jgi:hypothetical protein
MPFVMVRPRVFKNQRSPKAPFKINIDTVRKGFLWLKQHNPHYRDVEWVNSAEAANILQDYSHITVFFICSETALNAHTPPGSALIISDPGGVCELQAHQEYSDVGSFTHNIYVMGHLFSRP